MTKWICDTCSKKLPCFLEDTGGAMPPKDCPWRVKQCSWRLFRENKKSDIANDGFKNGDTVTWTSQASGITKTKTGEVVWVLCSADVKEGLNPRMVARNKFKDHIREFGGFGIPGKAAKGYLVSVITGPNSKPKLYMPYPSKLTLVKKS